MKKVIAIFASLLLIGLASPVIAGGGNGNSNAAHAQSGLPMQTVVKVLQKAAPVFQMPMGQLMQKYQKCECSIKYLGDGEFEVALTGGGDVVIVTIDAGQ